MAKCICNLCLARELNCHPLEVYFGIDSLEAKYVRLYAHRLRHEKLVYFAEQGAYLERLRGREVSLTEIGESLIVHY